MPPADLGRILFSSVLRVVDEKVGATDEFGLQRRIDVTDAESVAQAAESASRSFEALYGCPWQLHADSIEVNADPGQRIETQSNIRVIWPP
jgi:hypothetical protein